MNKASENLSYSAEEQHLLGILEKVETDSSVSQRALSSEVGIALGMVNTYIQRCVRKGWIKTQKIPAKRYAYYLTPQGMGEKTRLVKKYMQSSLSLFRQAKEQAEEIFQNRDGQTVALVGSGDLQEIVALVGRNHGLNITEMNVMAEITESDFYIVTDIEQPQQTYDDLCARVGAEKVYALPLLKVKIDG